MSVRATKVFAALALIFFLAVPAQAARNSGAKGSGTAVKPPPHPTRSLSKKKRKTIKKYKKALKRWRRYRAREFEAVAAGDFRGRHIVRRTSKVTAFLDWGDPVHPDWNPDRLVGEWDLISKIPVERRAHVLVIPNQKREHLTDVMGGKIRAGDLSHAEGLIREAEKVAERLGIANPNIFINPSDTYSVGYLHVHIIGERTRPYPDPL